MSYNDKAIHNMLEYIAQTDCPNDCGLYPITDCPKNIGVPLETCIDCWKQALQQEPDD